MPLPQWVPTLAPGPEGVAFSLPLAIFLFVCLSLFLWGSHHLTHPQAASLAPLCRNPLVTGRSPPIHPRQGGLHSPRGRDRRPSPWQPPLRAESRLSWVRLFIAAEAAGPRTTRPPRPGTLGTVVRRLFLRRARVGTDTQSHAGSSVPHPKTLCTRGVCAPVGVT